MKVQFLGAAGTVTGSRYLVSHGPTRLLIDCGLFQGFKNLRLRNWERFPVDPASINAILLTHAHLDHSGYIPKLIAEGFRGKVYCTEATRDLSEILLRDSGFLQEEEARFANRHGTSKHSPALPLYDAQSAADSLKQFESVQWESALKLGEGDDLSARFYPAGHLFGAASIFIETSETSIVFSGDLGRVSDPLTRNPSFTRGAHTVVIESTYGNRKHDDGAASFQAVQDKLADIISTTFRRGGSVLIPSFAVGRAQLLLLHLRQMIETRSIPEVPIYLNSPMAIRANDVLIKNFRESKLSESDAQEICALAKPVKTVEDSRRLTEDQRPKVIIAASGMATGGRVLHHLKAMAADARNTILFAGYQAGGTRGRLICDGAKEVKIHGQYWPIRARIELFDSLSGHADQSELLNWIGGLKQKPKTIFVTHGEPEAADALRRMLADSIRAEVVTPEQGQSFTLATK